MNNGQIRQGDVLLVPVATAPPEGLIPRTQVILAEGEVTGHAHRVTGNAILDWVDSQGERFVRALGNDAAALSHEDHDPIPAAVLAPGQTYRVMQQREWDLSGQWRQMVD